MSQEKLQAVAAAIRAKLDQLNQADPEKALLAQVMQQVFTVTNQTAAPVSTKPLEIFYCMPFEDEALPAVRDCLIIAWLLSGITRENLDRSICDSRGFLGKEIYELSPWMQYTQLPTERQRDELWEKGLNTLGSYQSRGYFISGDVIWKQGMRVLPMTTPGPTNSRACLALLATQVDYEDFAKLENPQWLRAMTHLPTLTGGSVSVHLAPGQRPESLVGLPLPRL